MAKGFVNYNLPEKEPQSYSPTPSSQVFPKPGGETFLAEGSFASPNFVHNKSGWRVDSQGNSEFNTGVTILGAVLTAGVFGGDGSDGALDVSSGITTIDLGGARYFVKNYSSISITGTGAIQFINPHANGTYIVIKCVGDCILTSTAIKGIDGTIAGAAGGAAVTSVGNADGNNGTDGQTYLITSNKGLKATAATPTPGNGGATGTFGFSTRDARMQKYNMAYVGAGAGSGAVRLNGGASATSGKGGRGGGALIMEVAGKLNFASVFTISCAGEDGGTGTHVTTDWAGGGGGGGGGFFLGLYGILIANAGTVSVSAGVGGNGSDDNTGVAGGGGGGSGENAGSNGVVGGSGIKTGGDGGAGKSFGWIKNTDF